MQTKKKVLIVVSCLSFLCIAIGLCTPGWFVLNEDDSKLQELKLKKHPPEGEQQYKEEQVQKQSSNVKLSQKSSYSLCPFYVRVCGGFAKNGVNTVLCTFISTTAAMSLIGMLNQTTDVPEDVDKHQAYLFQRNMHSIILALFGISLLVLIQIVVSLILTIVYTCIRYPKRGIWITGSACSIFSGVSTGVNVLVYLIMYGKCTKILKQDEFGEAFTFGFPYSIMFCCFGSILYFITGWLFTRVALKSKGQFNYEMMVIDTSKGGGTYVAKI